MNYAYPVDSLDPNMLGWWAWGTKDLQERWKRWPDLSRLSREQLSC